MNEDSSRLLRLEMTVQQHAELLQRAVLAMEAQTMINERMANHMDDTKRVWLTLENHGKELTSIQIEQVKTCEFCTTVRKTGWAITIFLSGGLAYLIHFWANRHGSS